MIDLDELRKIAEEATPGPWWVGDPQPFVPGAQIRIYHESGSPIRISGSDDRHVWVSPDGAFIATFNPETVLALLDRVETAERRIERLKNREQKAFEKLRESKAAIARVREQHRTYSYYELEDSCPDTSESHREERHHESDEIGEFYCEDMPTGVVVCEWCYDEDGERMDWPCPTIRALEGDK